MRGSLTGVVAIVVLAACGDGGDRNEVRTADSTASLTFRLGSELTDGDVDQLTSILENRLDALGAPDASVTVEGDEVIVEVPESRASRLRAAADVLGTTAELRFRPVLQTAISISGDFTEEEAKDLALVLRYGALPTSLELVGDASG